MKKFSNFVVVLILVASFTAPLLVYAGVGAGGTCVSPIECTSGVCSGGFCIGGVTTPAPGASGIDKTYLDFYYNLILTVVNSYLVPILIAVSFLMILYGAYKYFILKSAEEKERETGRTVMMYGVIGLVIIFSVWALVKIVRDTVIPPGSINSTAPTYPKL